MPLLCVFGLLLVANAADSRALVGTHILAISYTSNATWTLAGSPFIVDGDVQVASGATLTIEPGVVVKFNGTFRSMRITGTLKAIGTTTEPITFTSIQDDSIAGDSAGDGVTSGTPGQWYHIEVVAGTQSEFRNVDVRYGGYGSADWGYGAIAVTGTGTTVAIDHSDIHDNQCSGVYLYQGGATITHSTLSNNGNGVSANTGWVALADRTVVSTNRTDGVWFNYTSTYAGTTSSLYDSDVIDNGRYGINLGVPFNLPTSYWPHGNRNNIYDNASTQLFLGSYHPATTPQYNVDWTGNYWGQNVVYWTAPAACASAPPNSPGHLAYNNATGNPPDGPVTFSTYLAGTQSCAYDRFLISPSGFNTSYTRPEPQLTPAQHATVVSIAEGDARIQELLSGQSYSVSSVVPWSRVQTDLLLGAEITFSWTAPTTVSYAWPGVAYDYTEVSNPPYSESTASYTASNVTSLVVLVDLTRGLVVSIEPGLDSVVAQPPLRRSLRTTATDRRIARFASEETVEDQGGYKTNGLQKVCLGDTCFWNYDFSGSARQRGIRADRVDWPVSMIFWNGASINRVKDSMCTAVLNYCAFASAMYARIRDAGTALWVWDSDRGVKTDWCPTPGVKAAHMRLYADNDDQLGFNPTLGYFVIGTTHYDHNECALGIGKWSGHSEDAEKQITSDLVFAYQSAGWAFVPDAINLHNAESGRMEGNHRKQNNGMATEIMMATP